jgi:hypothetical protein
VTASALTARKLVLSDTKVLLRVQQPQGLKPNVTYFVARNTSGAVDLSELGATSDLLLVRKSSVAELSLNLTWNIYAFSGSFRRKERAFRMTAGFRGRNCCSPDEK